MGYAADILAIKSKLEATLKDIPEFGKRIYIQRFGKPTGYPNVFVFPGAETITSLDSNTREHRIEFSIQIEDRGKDPEKLLEETISHVGLILDKLWANRQLDGKCEDMVPLRVNYEYKWGETFIFHYALITIEILKYMTA